MSNSKVFEGTKRAIEYAMESKQFGNRLLKTQGIDPAAASALSPIDDGKAPDAPQWNVVTPYMAGLELDLRPAESRDFVAEMKIELTRSAVTTYMTVPYQYVFFVSPLLYEPYTIRVQYIDRWGRLSPWSTPATATPSATADYMIDLLKATQKGNLSGLIPAINTSSLSGNAEDTVKQIALATSGNTNLLTLREVDFEIYPHNTAWPPTDSDVNGVPYVTSLVAPGTTATVVDIGDRRWLRHTRGVGGGIPLIPFANFAQRGTRVGESYIFSAHVNTGKQIRLGVQGATDVAGSGMIEIASSGVITTTAGRVYIKFTVPTDKPFIRFVLENVVEGQSVDWARFQLEHAPGNSNEPSPWTAGVFSTGVVNARMIAAMDISAARAIFKDAAIESASIASLTANKIVSGVLQANVIMTAGGVKLTTEGIGLIGITSSGAPSHNAGSWLTPYGSFREPNPFAGVGFFQDDIFGPMRGVIVHADGVERTTTDGGVWMRATTGSRAVNHFTSSWLRLQSTDAGPGRIIMRGSLRGDGFSGDGMIYAGLAAGTGGSWPHPYNHTPLFTVVQSRNDTFTPPRWQPIADGVASWSIRADDSKLYVVNNGGSARDIRFTVIG